MSRRNYVVLYEATLDKLPIDILSFGPVKIDEYTISGGSSRYHNFMRSIDKKCVKCGIQATFFRVEYQRGGDSRGHINFYGYSDSGSTVMLTQDHIIPKSRGGKTVLENLQLMCARCNSFKGNLLPGEVRSPKAPKKSKLSPFRQSNFKKATKEILETGLGIAKTPLFVCQDDRIISWHKGKGSIVAAIPRSTPFKVIKGIKDKRQLEIEYQDKRYAVDYIYIGEQETCQIIGLDI